MSEHHSEMEMDLYSEDESDDATADGVDEYEESALKDLSDGKVSVLKIDGTLWCPFCFGKKKRDYKYAELFQHATGVGRGRGNRSPETVGAHSALAKYLKDKLAHLAEPPKERYLHLEQEAPERNFPDEKLVWPWMGIIMNIDNSKKAGGMNVGPGNSEIKSHFSRFHPKGVHTFWSVHGHTGTAVIEFEKHMIGYGAAQDFARSFLESGRGRKEWDCKIDFRKDAGKDLYGWLANQDDYNKLDLIGKYLRDKGNLRTVAEVSETFHRQNDQLLQDLDARIQEKNQKLEDSNRQLSGLQMLVFETERARRTAEYQKQQMEEMHKQEIQAIEREAQVHIQMLNEKVNVERQKLDAEFKNLQERFQELEAKEVHDDIERKFKELELDKNEKKMQTVRQIQELHKQQEAKKKLLIEKQEEESNSLLTDQHKQQKLLVSQHKLEQEIQALENLLASKRLEAPAEKTESQSDLSKLEEQLSELKEEKEGLEDMNQQLVYHGRALNDEIQDATKAALQVLKKKGNSEDVGIKRMGELNPEPWHRAYQQKVKGNADELQILSAQSISNWEAKIGNVLWHPFKTHIKGEKVEEHIDQNDEELANLRKELGEEVYLTVVTALEELQEYNASGRYPVPVIWNYREKKKATLQDVIQFLAMPPKRKKRCL